MTQDFIARRRLLGMATAGALAAPAIARAQGGSVWTLYSYVPSAALAPARVAQEIAGRVARGTSGALRLDYRLGGQLMIKGTDISAAVGQGLIEMGEDGLHHASLPVCGILRLPMLIVSREEMERALDAIRPFVERAYQRRGVTLLASYFFPGQTLWSVRKLMSLADLRDQVLRTTSAEQIQFLRRFGAPGVTISSAEVATALQRGTVDGVLTANAGGGRLWKDLLKFNLKLPVNYFEANFVANTLALSSLPARDRAVLVDAVAELVPRITTVLFDEEGREEAERRKEGIVVTEVDVDDRRRAVEAVRSYWDHWADSVDGKDEEIRLALHKVRDAVGR